jgi:hypothetical protein
MILCTHLREAPRGVIGVVAWAKDSCPWFLQRRHEVLAHGCAKKRGPKGPRM